MSFTTDSNFPLSVDLSPVVSEAVAAFKRLRVDDQLALLWVMHQDLGCSLTTAPGMARLLLTQGLLYQIKQMPPVQQVQVIQEIAAKADTPISRQYGLFVPTTKLVFWYQLFEWMSNGEVTIVPTGHHLSPDAAATFRHIASLDLSEQVKVVHQVVVDMGVEPLGD